jgi:nitronate monooxygenase
MHLLGLRHPIIQAPMAGSSNPALAAAVSNAGGLGSDGLGEATTQMVEEVVNAIRSRTNAAFNINLFVVPQANPMTAEALQAWRDEVSPFYRDAGLGEVPTTDPGTQARPSADVIDLLVKLRPPVVSFHFGLPDATAVARLKEAGCVVMSTATTVAEAVSLEDRGVDAIIAQGLEAGGHRGSHRPNRAGDGIGTMALVPQVVDAVAVPVIAAGGICDGRGIAAAMALGAAGVQMGTAFLRCPEASTDDDWRARLAQAKDTDTMVTDAFSGRCARVVRGDYAEIMATSTTPKPGYPALYAFSDPLVQAGAATFHLYGQAASLAPALPAAQLVEALARDALARMAALSRPGA